MNELLDALEFAEGAILDAIAHEDGLDGATGYEVLKMIWEQLDQHNRIRATSPELAAWLEGQFHVARPLVPVSLENRRLQQMIDRSGLDVCPCGLCGEAVLCVPEGLALCDRCEPKGGET